MKNWKSKLSGLFVFLTLGAYLLSFCGGFSFFIVESFHWVLNGDGVPLKTFLGWVTVGFSLSLLASLFAWPFALAITILIEHNRQLPLTRYFLGLTRYLSTLPLVLFVYFYIKVVGTGGFDWIKSFWTFSFASTNIFTQTIAFALTLLLYPLTAIPGVNEEVSVDLFYKKMLSAVVEFAEVGLVASVVVLGLFLYVLPKMVLQMRRHLKKDQNLRSFEIIKSMGGTSWESIHLTVMQSMKLRFNLIILFFTRLCFFEGLITYSLLNYFFHSNNEKNYAWTTSLLSQLISSMINPNVSGSVFIWLPGILAFIYVLFLFIEFQLRQAKRGYNV